MSSHSASLNPPDYRFLVISYTIPVIPTGTPVVIRRLLENFDAREVVLMGRKPRVGPHIGVQDFHYPIKQIPSPPVGVKGERYWMMLSVLSGLMLGVRLVRQYQVKAILGFFPDEGSLLTSYLLHRITGLPLMMYFCDLYLANRQKGWQAILARWLEPRIMGAAAKIFVLTSGMAEHFALRYGTQPDVIPHCINKPLPEFQASAGAVSPGMIGYVGSINEDRFGSIKLLVDAIGGNSHYGLIFFTPHSEEFLASLGLVTENTAHAFIPDEADFFQRLAECEILFLPVRFESNGEHAAQLVTGLATKTFDYLISGRPVFVLCPDEYFTARFFSENKCGLVVSKPEAAAILSGLEELSHNQQLQEELVQNAYQVAKRFKGERVANLLRAHISEII